MRGARIATRLARLEARQIQRSPERTVAYSHPPPSAAWYQEFWEIVEASGYLPDILGVLEREAAALVAEAEGNDATPT
jgi:hypothetical protein